MKANLLFFAICCLLYVSAIAQPVTEHTALQIARNFLASQVTLKSASLFNQQEVKAITGVADTLCFLFDDKVNSTYIIVAHDECMPPVLAYSTEGSFPETDVAPGFLAMLKQQHEEIEYLLKNNIAPSAEIREMWNRLKSGHTTTSVVGVSPLLTTKWDQGCYYNAACPYDAGSLLCSHVPTGCTATAMAQILKYHNYAKGTGSHGYNSRYGYLSANFAGTTYNFSAMPNSVTSANTEVARLMSHVGIALDMDYGTKESGAWKPLAFSYFGYSASLKEIFRSSESNFTSLLKQELDAGRPVLYRGDNGSNGHAFVLDGYNSDNTYHLNWGWSGTPNSYFYLSNLNPNGYNFTLNQSVVIGIQPASNKPDLIIAAGTQKATPTTLSAGSDITVSCAIDNQGSSSAASSNVSVWLGSSVLKTSTGIYLGKISFSSLAASSCSVVKTATLKIPSSTPAAKYYLWFWADGDQNLAESVEDNNFASVQVTITSGAGEGDCLVQLDHTSATHNPESFSTESGDDIIVTTKPYCKITISNSVSWISVFPSSTTANNVGQILVNYSIRENTTQSDRQGTFYINGVPFTIKQRGCTFEFYPATKSVSASGATYKLDIDSYDPCEWTILNKPSWVRLSQLSGSGDPTITVTVDPNPDCKSRIVELRLSPGNSVHTITQQGSGGQPAITQQPVHLTVTVNTFAKFTVKTDGANLKHQWQVKIPGGEWNNTADGGSFTGSNTPDLLIQPVTREMSGSQFRCQISNSCTQITTGEVTLTVNQDFQAFDATDITPTSFVANWSKDVGAQWYSVDVAFDPDFESMVPGCFALNAGNNTSIKIANLLAGTNYYYRVTGRAQQSFGIASNTIKVLTSGTKEELVGTPVLQNATEITSASFRLNWSTVNSALGYLVDISTDGSFGSFVAGYRNLDVGNVNSFVARGLNLNTSYTIRVCAYNASGTKGKYSNYVLAKTNQPGNQASLTIGNGTGSVGGTVVVPVFGSNLTNIAAFQGSIEFDKLKLEFTGFSDWAVDSKEVTVNPLNDRVSFVYSDQPFSLINGGVLCKLNFKIKANVQDKSFVNWTDVPTPVEFSDVNGNVTSVSLQNGSVSVLQGNILSGQFSYANNASTPLSGQITLTNTSAQKFTGETDQNGNFSLSIGSLGNYKIGALAGVTPGGFTAIDLTMSKKHIAGISTLSAFQVRAADANGNGSLTAADVNLLRQRILGQITQFTAGDMVIDPGTLQINGSTTQNLKGLWVGDVNGSWEPSLKSALMPFVATKDPIRLREGYYQVPLRISKDAIVGSVTLKITLPNELKLVSVLGFPNSSDLSISTGSSENVVLYSTTKPLPLNQNDILCTLALAPKSGFLPNVLTISGSAEIGDVNDRVVLATLSYPSVFNPLTGTKDHVAKQFMIFPNPAAGNVWITGVDESDRIEICDLTGKILLTKVCSAATEYLNISHLTNGFYSVRIISRNGSCFFDKLVIRK